VAAVAVAAVLAGPLHAGPDSLFGALPTPRAAPAPIASGASSSPAPRRAPSAAAVDLTWLVWAAVAAGLVVVVRVMLRGRRDNRPIGPAPAPDELPDPSLGTRATVDELRRAAAWAAARARQGGPPRDAVVACWVALEAAALTAGTQRAPQMTPTEFTTSVLAAHDADRSAIDTLLHLYHRARFTVPAGDAGATVSGADALAAAAALDRIAATLGRPPPAPGAP